MVVFTTILLVISTHSLTNQQLALFLTILGSDSSQDHESMSLADVKKEILCWKSANVLTVLPLLLLLSGLTSVALGWQSG